MSHPFEKFGVTPLSPGDQSLGNAGRDADCLERMTACRALHILPLKRTGPLVRSRAAQVLIHQLYPKRYGFGSNPKVWSVACPSSPRM